MTVSFGVEFEFYLISSDGRVSRSHHLPHYPRVEGWGEQDDSTVSVELCSPVFTSLNEYFDSVKREFECFVNNYDEYVPYPVSDSFNHAGMHVHVGLPNRHLTRDERTRVGLSVLPFYPMLAGIHACPVPSVRGLRTQYARVMPSVEPVSFADVAYDSHYMEVSFSGHGTVEFRLFDANIPQVNATCLALLLPLVERVLNGDCEGGPTRGPALEYHRYVDERGRALRHGVMGVNLPLKLTQYQGLVGEVDLGAYDCVRDLMYLAAKYGLNAHQVFEWLQPNAYEYFKTMYTNPRTYFSNLVGLADGEKRAKITEWKTEAERFTTLSQFIELARATYRALARVNVRVVRGTGGLPRSVVAEHMRTGNYRVTRIGEVSGMSTREVAERVSRLIDAHGDGMVNRLSADEVIQLPERFYVLTVARPNGVGREIVGCVALRVRDGLVCHLTVDRRYRRLGVAKALLQHVVEEARRCGLRSVYAYVKRSNAASIALNLALGFRREGESEETILFRREV